MMRGFVLPPAGPGRVVEWTVESQLLGVLYREIGVDCVDSARVPTPAGVLSMWVDDNGLLTDQPVFNDRAIAMCRAFGYNVAALAGTVVFAGGPTSDGNTPGLTDDQLALCERLVEIAAALP